MPNRPRGEKVRGISMMLPERVLDVFQKRRHSLDMTQPQALEHLMREAGWRVPRKKRRAAP